MKRNKDLLKRRIDKDKVEGSIMKGSRKRVSIVDGYDSSGVN